MKKSKFFENLPGKIKIFRKFAWKNQNFCEIAWRNQNFFEMPIKIEILLTRIHDPPDFKSD